MTVIITRMSDEMRARRIRMGMMPLDAQELARRAAEAKAKQELERRAKIEQRKEERRIIAEQAAAYREAGQNAAFTAFQRAKAIVQETALAHGVDVAAIMSSRRCAKITAARVDCIARVALATTWSQPRLGTFFGRDHTTILYSLRVAALRHGITIREITPEIAQEALKDAKRLSVGRLERLTSEAKPIDVRGIFSTAKPKRSAACFPTLNPGAEVSFREAAE